MWSVSNLPVTVSSLLTSLRTETSYSRCCHSILSPHTAAKSHIHFLGRCHEQGGRESDEVEVRRTGLYLQWYRIQRAAHLGVLGRLGKFDGARWDSDSREWLLLYEKGRQADETKNYAGRRGDKATRAVLATLLSLFGQCRAFGDGLKAQDIKDELVRMVSWLSPFSPISLTEASQVILCTVRREQILLL